LQQKGDEKMRRYYFWLAVLGVLTMMLISTSVLAVPGLINYQGKLTDSDGNPLTGTYEMTFFLLDAPTLGTIVWSENHASVTVTDGIYNVQLGSVSNPFTPNLFVLYDELYLEVHINSESLVPRQPVTCTAFSMKAAVAETVLDGAVTTVMIADSAVDSQKVADSAITSGKVASNAITSEKIADGAVTAADILDGPGSGLDADTLDGLDSTAFGDITDVTAGTGLSGGGSSGAVSLSVTVPLSLTGDIATGGIVSCENTNATGFGGFFEATGESGRGVLGRATGSSGQGVLGFSMGQFGRGVYGWATGTSGEGIRGYSTGASGRGAYGYATGTFGWGVFGEASNTYGRGVYGHATNTGDVTNYGGYFEASGTSGIGAYGKTTGNLGYGVYGDASGGGTAGYFTSTSGYGLIVENGNVGIGTSSPTDKLTVSGAISSQSNTTYGIYSESSKADGIGVQGYASNSASLNYGGYFEAAGTDGRGVYGRATNSGDVYNYGGYFTAAGTNGRGVYGEATGTDGWGVFGSASGPDGHGVHGGTYSPSGAGVYGANVYVGPGTGYGGRFVANSTSGQGVRGFATGSSGTGVYGEAIGSSGEGVHGSAAGSSGTGVYGEATNTGNVLNYGGYFRGLGEDGYGVFAQATGLNGTGVYGWSTQATGVYGRGAVFDFYAGGAGINYGPFTGAHEVKFSEDMPGDIRPGMIVSVTGRAEKRMKDTGEISLSSTMPTVTLARKSMDKAVLGVLVSEGPLDKDHWYEAQEEERFGVVNALGEGRMFVTNTNGDIEAGDYITTSAIPGYGQKQEDDLVHSYTVGKAIETVDWDSVTETIDSKGETHKVYLIAVVYTSG